MHVQDVKEKVLSIPEISHWPAMTSSFEKMLDDSSRIKWELPMMTCRAVGSNTSAALSGAAAIACMQHSLVLIDDMLDEDPRGEYINEGYGNTSNVAFAFQAAAYHLIDNASLTPALSSKVMGSLAKLALTSSYGQYLDTRNLGGEENYWLTVRTKSTPFFGTAFEVGALFGKASLDEARQLRKIGQVFGEVIQIHDDLNDALHSPASPDWIQNRSNLAILFALTADHPGQRHFEALLPEISYPAVLEEAQQVLIDCGAVSYCAYHVVKRYQYARQVLDSMRLADPIPLQNLLQWWIQPFITLLSKHGNTIPMELFEP